MRGLQTSWGIHVPGETSTLFALASQSMRLKVNEPKLEPSHSVSWSSAFGLAIVVQDCFPATRQNRSWVRPTEPVQSGSTLLNLDQQLQQSQPAQIGPYLTATV